MKLVIGIDEAGYGPNMGPLVIAASLWRVDGEPQIDRGLALLEPEFRGQPWHAGDPFIPMGDSKKIYRPGLSLHGLQAGMRFLLEECGQRPERWSDLLHSVAPSDAIRLEQLPWYAPAQRPAEIETSDGIDVCPPLNSQVIERARQKMASHGIRFLGYRARVIDELEFNRTVDRLGNKSNALSEWSIGLLADCIRNAGDRGSTASDPLRVDAYCDRHGGRKRYAAVLNHALGELVDWIEVLEETSHCSRYRARLPSGELKVQFRVEGDSLLPSAASSLLAKWLREHLMQRLNQYWIQSVGPTLRPTAGYSVDAARFREEMTEHAKRLGHPQEAWWRWR
jgi:ribonuclease HII